MICNRLLYICRWPLCTPLLLLASLTLAAAQQPAADPAANLAPPPASERALGSTATLEQLHFTPPTPTVEQPPEDRTELSIRAAAEPIPALRYRFWPHWVDCKPGRAETHFYRAILLYRELDLQTRTHADMGFLDKFASADPQQVAEFLDAARTTLTELETMAACQDQTWDLRIRDQQGLHWVSVRLPDVQEARGLARLLSIQARQQLADNNFTGFCHTLQVGFRLAAFVGQGETMVQQLVGVAIAGVMLGLVEQAIELPGCPNLYWALASLPKPLVDLRRSIEFESTSLIHAIPAIRAAESVNLTDEQWREKFAEFEAFMKTLGFDAREQVQKLMIGVLFSSQAQAEAARQRLIDAGHDPQGLHNRSRAQLMAMDTALQLTILQDGMIKASLVPGYQSFELPDLVDRSDQRPGPALVIAGIVLPAYQAALEASIRTDFNVERLKTIESIRQYLSDHPHQFPETLDSLTVMPTVDDPFTGKPFQYQLDASVDPPQAVITASDRLRWPQKQRTILRVSSE